MKLKKYAGGSLAEVDFDASRFGEKVLFRTLKDAALMYRANARLGTVNTRGRDEVVGSNKKPWKQKHTGRARAGDRKSPIWRGGGTVFGPKPRDYSYHMPLQARRVALRSALAGKLGDGEVAIVELETLAAPSAKAARKLLAALGSPARALVVLRKADVNAYKSFRNFPGVRITSAADLNALDVINGGLIVAESGALESVAERVRGRKAAASSEGAAT